LIRRAIFARELTKSSVGVRLSSPEARRRGQAAVVSHLVAAGHGYLCSSDYRDVIETLKG
jgi:hypothetical protein